MKVIQDYMEDILLEPKDKEVDLKLSQSPLFNPSFLKDKLKDISKFSDGELFNIIRDNYEEILKDVFENKKYIDLFKDSRFLSVFIQALNSVDNLGYINRVYCNKIAYDYLTLSKQDKYIAQLLLSLSKTVNRDILPSLIILGLDENLAAKLALDRHSSFKEEINVKRVNFDIICSSIRIMTEQMIIYIYEKLFERITPVFIGIMFDTYKETDGFSEEMGDIYSIISLVILDIMENMPSEDIRRILLAYYNDYILREKENKEIRFSMQSLGPDFKRISQIVEQLYNEEKIYIP